VQVVAYELLRRLARIALSWYYGRVEATGLERVPSSGPVFLAGNHPNALMDALVIGVLVPRRVRMLAKATLFTNPLVARVLHALGVIPLHRAKDAAVTGAPADDPARNAASFRAVSDALADGAAVLIFPEGISHDAPQLAPLRTGLARMALEARDTHGVRALRIVPMGLVFEAKESPRTRVLLQVGDPLALDALPAGADTVAALTAEVERRLRAVTLNFACAEEATRITSLAHALAVLLTPVRPLGEDEHRLADVVRLTQRIARAAERVAERVGERDARDARDPLAGRVTAFVRRFEVFLARLAEERLDLADLGIDPGAAAGARFAVREGALALVRGPVGLWGRINHWLPITLTRSFALRGVRSRDEPAMRSVVLGLGVVLGFYVVQASVVAALAGPWWAAAYTLTLVPSAGHDLRYGDRTRRARTRMRAYFRFRREPALQAALLAEAAWLRSEAGALEAAV
jgi:1-acyl-sn-glycerol-3-phosphate acyltransferase